MTYKHRGSNAPNVPKTNIKTGYELFILELFSAVISLGFAYFCWTVDAILGLISSLLFGLALTLVILWQTVNFTIDLMKKFKNKKDD